jgi:hypothetical protein
MTIFDTGAEERAYEMGFAHGEESGIFIGETRAEERIIKVIEQRRDYDCTCKCDCHAHEAPCITCTADNGLIALIKKALDTPPTTIAPTHKTHPTE